MNRKAIILAFAALLTVSTVSAQISPELEDRLEQRPDTEKVDVIILTQPNANEQAKNAVRNTNGNVSHDFDIIDGVAVSIPKVAADNLAQRDFVREIQPDYSVETRLSESTETVNANQVWNENTTAEGVDVAVLDTGIEDNTILNVEDQVDYTGEGTDDLNGHGTHVAGIVASPNDEYRGVAYGADLFDVKVLDGDGAGSASDVISGLEYAADNNAEVAVLSLGAEVESCDGTSSLSEAVDNAVEEGLAVTVAAGNNGPDSGTITAPGCAERGITVGSSGNGEISDFSSRGPTADGRTKPDLVAPGEGITSLTNNDGDSPQFETLSGTSMATPHVAGAAALLLSEQDLTPSEVKNITTYTAEDLGFDENSQGAGRLDAYAAYRQVAQTENQTGNETGNQAPTVEALETQVTLLNESAEVEIAINAEDTDNESLETTFYFEGEQVSQQEGYGEITHTESNLSLNETYSWSAEVTDGINTSTTGTQSFNTDTNTEEEESENETRPPLPEEASDRARQARGGGLFGPSSGLYGLDIALDRASVAIGLRSREDVMEERAQEARNAAEQGDNEAAEKAVRSLRNTAGNSENASREVEETLNRVIEDAPEEARQGLQNALGNVERERQERENRRSGNQGRRPESNESGQNQRERDQAEQRPENPSEENSRTPQERTENRETANPNQETQNRPEDNSDQSGQNDGRSNQENEQNQQPSNEASVGANAEARGEAETGNTGVEAEAEAEAGVQANTQTETEEQTSRRGNTGSNGPSNPAGNPNAGGPLGNFFEKVF